MNKQLNDEKKKLTLEDFPKDNTSPGEERVLNFIQSDVVQSPIKTLWSTTSGKVIIVSAATILLLYAAGYLFRVLAYVKEGYAIFMATGNMPLVSAPKV